MKLGKIFERERESVLIKARYNPEKLRKLLNYIREESGSVSGTLFRAKMCLRAFSETCPSYKIFIRLHALFKQHPFSLLMKLEFSNNGGI